MEKVKSGRSVHGFAALAALILLADFSYCAYSR